MGIPAVAFDAIKDRLVRAEVEYRTRNGKQKAIDERDVVRMVNNLADTLQLPDYAKTNTLQVRHLRMGVWPRLKDFIRQEDAKERAKPNAHIGLRTTTKMSPLEATYLAMLMLQQKANNAAYQITPNEERRFAYNLKLERWTAHRNGKDLESQNLPRLKAQGEDNPKAGEIREAVSRGLTSLTSAQLGSLPNNLLDTLGIQR